MSFETVTNTARLVHPDVPGGTHEEMAELNAARDQALAEIGA